MPPFEEGPPKKLTIDGVVYDVVRHGKAYREKAMTKKQILDYKATWSTTWIVARPNGKWDEAKDPDGHERYHSYHILFCGLATEQKFLNKSQIDALLKSTNVGAGGPAQRVENERMLISWNGKTIWVAARTLTERKPRSEPAREASEGAAPAPAPAKKAAARANGPPAKKQKQCDDDYFWNAKVFATGEVVAFGCKTRRTWVTQRILQVLVSGPPRLKHDYCERTKAKSIKPVDGRASAPEGARANGDARATSRPVAGAAAAAAASQPAKHVANTTKTTKPGCATDAPADLAYAPQRTHAQVVQTFVDYMSGDERVPADVRAFFQTHNAIMAHMVDKYGATQEAPSRVFGHMFTVSKLPASDWTKANLEAFARKYGEENRDRSLAMWQAQTATFNQLFAATLTAAKEPVSMDDLY